MQALLAEAMDALHGCVDGLALIGRGPRKTPTAEEASDLGVLWHMLHLHLHPNWPHSNDESHDMRQLTRAEFQFAFGLGWNAAIIKRIFDMLDEDKDDLISLDDFAIGLFPLASIRATLDDRLRFLFRCFDLDGSGAVSQEDLLVHLHLYATQGLYADDCAMTPEQLEAVVWATFEQAADNWAGTPNRAATPTSVPVRARSPPTEPPSPSEGATAAHVDRESPPPVAATLREIEALQLTATQLGDGPPALPPPLLATPSSHSEAGAPPMTPHTEPPSTRLDKITWRQFNRMLRSRPMLVEQMLTRLGLDVNRAVADLVMGLDDRWLTIEQRGRTRSRVDSAPGDGALAARASPGHHPRNPGSGHSRDPSIGSAFGDAVTEMADAMLKRGAMKLNFSELVPQDSKPADISTPRDGGGTPRDGAGTPRETMDDNEAPRFAQVGERCTRCVTSWIPLYRAEPSYASPELTWPRTLRVIIPSRRGENSKSL